MNPPTKQWIPVTDRIPVKADANSEGKVWYYDPETHETGLAVWSAVGFVWGNRLIPNSVTGFSHWMSAESKPKPPGQHEHAPERTEPPPLIVVIERGTCRVKECPPGVRVEIVDAPIEV